MKLHWAIASENAIKFWYEFPNSNLETTGPGSQFYAHLRREIKSGKFSWIEDIVAAEASLTVFFNSLLVNHRVVRNSIRQHLLGISVDDCQQSQELITLPVIYGGETGQDIQNVAARCGLTVPEVIQLHQESVYCVTAVGFAPGFGYLKGLPDALNLPRRDDPRISVPKGAVAIAENYTAIYPESSPGGWHLIGYCPETLFDISLPVPALFKVGQQVKFVSVTG